MNRGIAIPIIIVGILLLGLAVVYLYWDDIRNGGILDLNPPSLTPSPTGVVGSVTPGSGSWQTYNNDRLGFSVSHPVDMMVTDRAQNGVSFFKKGPGQTENTELHDGINLIFSGGNHGSNLRSYVEARRNNDLSNPALDEVGEIDGITINGINGHTYRVKGLGEWQEIFLPKGDSEFIEIVNNTVDPNNQGYQAIVERMLNSLNFYQESKTKGGI